MRKRRISVCIVMILVFCIFGCARTAEDTHDAEEASVEAESEDAAETTILEEEQEQDVLEPYYGFYRISEIFPAKSRGAARYDWLPDQEADMLLGRIVELGADRFVTYDSLRKLGTNGGRAAFDGNYIVEEIVIEDPQYSWEPLTEETVESEMVSIYPGIFPEGYIGAVEGKIDIQIASPWGNHYYYVMPDGILRYSTLSSGYFYLEKLEEEPERQEERVLSAEEKSEILQKLLGTYTVVEFLPTKFYPASDPNGDPYLPEEEAEMMIGKEITVEEDIFVSYDNFRRPNSEFVERSMDDFWVERVDIPSPDYQIEEKEREELYGLRDDMLRDELQQNRYIEISVFPGYSANNERCLPQLYLLDDSRIIMYAMGEYFLLEKGEDKAEEVSDIPNHATPFRDFEEIEKNHKILEYDICSNPRYDYKNTFLADYYKDDIKDTIKLIKNIYSEEELRRWDEDESEWFDMDYHLFDFNDDGLEDYLVCIYAVSWTGSGGNSVDILVQEEDGTFREVLSITLRLINYEPPDMHEALTVLDEKTDGYYAIVTPFYNRILRYDKERGRYDFQDGD